MKRIILAFSLLIFLAGCKKESNVPQPANSENITNTSNTHKILAENHQNVIVNGVLYDLELNSKAEFNTNEEVTSVPLYVNCPQEVQDFLTQNEKTLIPHYVLGETETYLFYYKDIDDFAKNVHFENGPEKTKSLRGAQLSQWDNGNFTGASISEYNTTYRWFQPLPTSYNAVYGYGIRNVWVGGSLNDRISIIHFAMINGDEPITYVGYEDSRDQYCLSCGGGRMVIITKMKALASNGTNVGTNNALLWNIGYGSFWRTWNDRISSYDWWQSNVTLPVGVTIR